MSDRRPRPHLVHGPWRLRFSGNAKQRRVRRRAMARLPPCHAPIDLCDYMTPFRPDMDGPGSCPA